MTGPNTVLMWGKWEVFAPPSANPSHYVAFWILTVREILFAKISLFAPISNNANTIKAAGDNARVQGRWSYGLRDVWMHCEVLHAVASK